MSTPERAVADAELLERFRHTRDELAFAKLVERHGPMVLAVGRRLLAGCLAADEQDVLQATFLALAKSAGRVRSGDAVPGWLHRACFEYP